VRLTNSRIMYVIDSHRKTRRCFIHVLAAGLSVFGLALPVPVRAQEDLFESGVVRLVEEARTSDDDLPEDALFINPRFLAMDAEGNIYLSDFDAHHVKVFGPDGKFKRLIGRNGQGPGELAGPSNIEVAGNRLIVWEAFNNRFSIMTLDGKFEKTAPRIHGGYGDLYDLKALPDGRLIALVNRGVPADYQGPLPAETDYAVLLLSPDLKPLKTIFEQTLVRRKWYKHPETQNAAPAPFPYHPRVCMDVSPKGRIAIGVNRAYEIDWHDADKGRIAAVNRPFAPVRVEDRDKKAHFDGFKMRVIIDEQSKIINKAPSYIVENTEFPETMPPFREIIFDGRGNLWVLIFPPDRRSNIFDVFSPEGMFLNRITVEGGWIEHSVYASSQKRFHGDFLWKIEKDAEDFSSLVKYRIMPGK